jgi:hypothetical protein
VSQFEFSGQSGHTRNPIVTSQSPTITAPCHAAHWLSGARVCGGSVFFRDFWRDQLYRKYDPARQNHQLVQIAKIEMKSGIGSIGLTA